MRALELLAGAALLGLLPGCATRSLDLAPASPDRPWAPTVDARGEIEPGVPSAIGGDHTYSLPANEALAVLPGAPQIDAQHEYTLPELIDIAETANPSARVAWDEAKQAALAVGMVKSSYLPRLTATAAGIDLESHSDRMLDATDADGSGSGRALLSAVSLQWLLFDFGERRALVRAAQQLSIVSNIKFNATHQKIIHDVSVAYYAAASAHEEALNAERSLSEATAVQTAVEQRRNRGQTTVVEAAQAKQASAQARLAAVQAHGRETDARIGLLAAMGVLPMAPLKLAPIPYRPLDVQDGIAAGAAVSRALSRRPDMLAALAAQRAADQIVEVARSDFRPKVFVTAGASYQTGHLDISALPGTGGTDRTDNLTGNSRSAHAMIGVTVPIFDGGMRSARLAQARSRADGAAAQLDGVRNLAVHEIVVAQSTVGTSVAAYAAAADLLAAAQITFDAALGSYRSGVGNLTDVNMAGMSLMNARNARSRAYSDALASAATLALATGELGSTPGIASAP